MDPRTYTHMQYGFPVHAPAQNRLLPATQRSPAPQQLSGTPGVGTQLTGMFDVPDMNDKQRNFTAFVGVAAGVGGLLVGTAAGYLFWGR